MVDHNHDQNEDFELDANMFVVKRGYFSFSGVLFICFSYQFNH